MLEEGLVQTEFAPAWGERLRKELQDADERLKLHLVKECQRKREGEETDMERYLKGKSIRDL